MVEEHADRDLGRVGEAAYYVEGQHLREPGVERQPPLLGELEHHDGDERLDDAAGAEAIGGAHRRGRRHPAEADHARPGAEPGAVYVQDRSREVRTGIGMGVVKHPLEPTSQDRVKARVRRTRRRRVSCGARRPGKCDGSQCAGAAEQQRPAVHGPASGVVSERLLHRCA